MNTQMFFILKIECRQKQQLKPSEVKCVSFSEGFIMKNYDSLQLYSYLSSSGFTQSGILKCADFKR